MSLFKNIFGSSDNQQSETKVGWRQLTDLGQLNEISDESNIKPFIIFKHSTRCSVSRMALRQFEHEFNLQEKITPYFLDLLEHRDISNEIENRFGVMHQSPQLLLIKNGKCIYDASHNDINAEDLHRFLV